MPKAKQKVKSVDRHDRGKSWGTEEEDLLVECWSREGGRLGVKDKLDGTVRALLAHESIEKYLKARVI